MVRSQPFPRREDRVNIHKNAKLTPLEPTSSGGLLTRARAPPRWLAPSGSGQHGAHVGSPRYRGRGRDGLLDRSSRPHRQPRALPPTVAALVVALRRRLEWSPDRRHGASVSRHRQSDPPPRGTQRLAALDPPPPVRRTVFAALDTASTHDRRRTVRAPAGNTYVCVDDHSRVAFSKVYPDETAANRVSHRRACLLPASRHPCPPRADRQRWVLPLPSLQRTLYAGRPPPSLHPPLHAPDQREGRTLHPDRTARVGLCPRLQHLRPAHRASRALAAPLQLAPATRSLKARPPISRIGLTGDNLLRFHS